MAFTLLDIVGRLPARLEDMTIPQCPSGKVSYRTKREARQALKGVNRSLRHTMHAFCCGYGGDHYHLGHHRGRS